MGVGGQRHLLAALSPGKTRHPLYRRLGGPQGRSGRVRKISPPPGFHPRTVQPVASRYTDCANPAPQNCIIGIKKYVHVCVFVCMCVCARALIKFVALTDVLPLSVEMFGLLFSCDKQ